MLLVFMHLLGHRHHGRKIGQGSERTGYCFIQPVRRVAQKRIWKSITSHPSGCSLRMNWTRKI